MTEAEWLASVSPRRLLEYVKKARSRKLRLFACACARRAGSRISNPICLEAIEMAERFADKQEKNATRETASHAVRRLCGKGTPAEITVAYHVSRGTRYTFVDAGIAAAHAVLAVTGVRLPGENPPAEDAESAEQCRLARDIFGNPFRSIGPDQGWKTANTKLIAAAIYHDRAFDRLPVLADALEEAGCTDEAILSHCRGPGPHVRGCWVVDLILGKE